MLKLGAMQTAVSYIIITLITNFSLLVYFQGEQPEIEPHLIHIKEKN